ncbi:MAG: GNAT family N-acetyltransferase [Paracoccaceae bacterium]|nr:GNAT family N-acetyltransferase [Paracoccaceae bacterium]
MAGDTSAVASRRRPGLVVRDIAPGEAAALGTLFFRAVRDGAAAAYSAEQRRAWAPEAPSGATWAHRLESAETLVAEQDGRLVGFMTLKRETGVIDLAFVLPQMMGRGIGTTLYAVLENRARAAGIRRLSTDASDIARAFFERQGWETVARQSIVRGGVIPKNQKMSKALT